eukprot:COSAG02_NODE_24641_length_681_cov_2.300687_2_plen_98_part_01
MNHVRSDKPRAIKCDAIIPSHVIWVFSLARHPGSTQSESVRHRLLVKTTVARDNLPLVVELVPTQAQPVFVFKPWIAKYCLLKYTRQQTVLSVNLHIY